MLEVFIIAPPGGTRAHGLVENLNSKGLFQVNCVDAIMTPELDDLKPYIQQIDFPMIHAAHGRILSPAEIGCTLSHNLARLNVSCSQEGAVILEDDAIIEDTDAFRNICLSFLESKKNSPALLNLHFDGLLSSAAEIEIGFRRRISPTSLAVGYALTPKAAKKMLQLNSPVCHMGDWPPCNLHFYTVTRPVVEHDYSEERSFLGERERRVNNSRLGYSVLTFSHYVKNRKLFVSWQSWFKFMYLPRLRNILDKSWFGFLSRFYGWVHSLVRQ